jgi:hypothetical protein
VTLGRVIEATTDDIACAATAIQIGETLTAHYPGHLWLVGWQGGSIVVRDASISGDYGFYIHPDKSYSASELKKKAIMFAGELLERANMKRGKWDGNFATSLEGADPRRPIL